MENKQGFSDLYVVQKPGNLSVSSVLLPGQSVCNRELAENINRSRLLKGEETEVNTWAILGVSQYPLGILWAVKIMKAINLE